MDLDTFQAEVGGWGEETFPDATLGTILDHFAEEAIELVGIVGMEAALARAKQKIPRYPSTSNWIKNQQHGEEAADCTLLLLHFCHRRGLSLMEEMQHKMVVNRARTWDTGTARGYRKHIEKEQV